MSTCAHRKHLDSVFNVCSLIAYCVVQTFPSLWPLISVIIFIDLFRNQYLSPCCLHKIIPNKSHVGEKRFYFNCFILVYNLMLVTHSGKVTVAGTLGSQAHSSSVRGRDNECLNAFTGLCLLSHSSGPSEWALGWVFSPQVAFSGLFPHTHPHRPT